MQQFTAQLVLLCTNDGLEFSTCLRICIWTSIILTGDGLRSIRCVCVMVVVWQFLKFRPCCLQFDNFKVELNFVVEW
ncbi:hypothetical protein T07_9313 [Trichinella nelsoni]|uniref:Uncharacterized protein n=1 Tax=Trichinella nelsoni TaxID=6336 RepID=A0A0V0SID7_9BILA|nr:hypothetical protein T07_9313 [Trichinella nelsoni]